MSDVSAMENLSSEELAVQAQAGSDDCFSELVRRHSAGLLGFLSRKVPNRHDAEDLTQETFARAHSRLHQYKPGFRFQGWLYTIAARLSVSHYRRRQDVAMEIPEQATRQTPASTLEQSENRANLWDTIATILPDSQQQVLWLRYHDDLAVKDIALYTRRSVVSVKVLLHRARTRLADTLSLEDLS